MFLDNGLTAVEVNDVGMGNGQWDMFGLSFAGNVKDADLVTALVGCGATGIMMNVQGCIFSSEVYDAGTLSFPSPSLVAIQYSCVLPSSVHACRFPCSSDRWSITVSSAASLFLSRNNKARTGHLRAPN